MVSFWFKRVDFTQRFLESKELRALYFPVVIAFLRLDSIETMNYLSAFGNLFVLPRRELWNRVTGVKEDLQDHHKNFSYFQILLIDLFPQKDSYFIPKEVPCRKEMNLSNIQLDASTERNNFFPFFRRPTCLTSYFERKKFIVTLSWVSFTCAFAFAARPSEAKHRAANLTCPRPAGSAYFFAYGLAT